MAYTTYLDNALVAHAVGKTAYTMPTTYVGLFTTAPTMPAGTSGVEAAYTGYARAATSGDWGSPSGGAISNSAAISFAACTAGTSTVVAFGVFDALTAGNLLMEGTCSLSVSTGITPQFASGALTVSQT
jgi:hypothetical protein